MTLGEKRGVDVKSLLESFCKVKSPKPWLQLQLFDDINQQSGCAVLYLLSSRPHDAMPFASRVVEAGIEYFHGDWNQAWEKGVYKYTRADFRKLVWQPELLLSTGWAMALDRWEDARKLLDYVGPDLDAYTEPDRKAFWIALRDFVSGKPPAEYEQLLRQSQKAKSKSHEWVHAAFDALIVGDAAAFHERLVAQFTAYAKRNRKPRLFSDAFNWYGSILYYVGLQRGTRVSLPPLESEFLLSFDQPKQD
ncbi:MAG TPA: hypothetical protein VGN72_17560 [Tepidisphaeraceae bacterium]|jgi:hypothetical protein|nr:hypothetical protein [Tepidisphaeraceae bacterium]